MEDSAADECRERFAFAHDLRSHLRTVLTRVQMVQGDKTATLPERDRLFLEEAVTAAREMDALIGAMTAYWDAGRVEAATIGLPLLLQGVLLEAKIALTQAGATVSIENESDTEVPRALQAVVKELIGNSCKFRHRDRKPEIRISTRILHSASLEITVIDNGTGIASEFLDQLFVPFRRLHSRSDYPGFGLGLARCRKIVEACGGTVSAASVRPGLAVTVTLPIPENS